MNRIAAALVATSIAAFAWSQPAPATRTYTNKALGLAFDHPGSWSVATTRKDEATFRLSEGVVVELFPSTYRQEAASWQALQVQISKNLDRTVERQWEEEILGVPLLMTKIAYEVQGQPTKTLVGLLYTSSANKLLFRLTAPAVAFDEAEARWREALQTLRTTTGQLPTTDDPSRPVAPPPTPTAEPRPLAPKAAAPRVAIAPKSVAVQSGGVAVELRFPDGWTAEGAEGGFTLKHPSLAGSLRVAVNALLDSPTPDKALASAAAESLREFDAVAKRIDSRPRDNRALAKVLEVRRTGTAAGAARTLVLATGLKSGHYWFATYRGDGAAAERDRGLLGGLLDQLSVEPSP